MSSNQQVDPIDMIEILFQKLEITQRMTTANMKLALIQQK